MSNNLTTRPWVIDTPSDSVLFDGQIKVSHMVLTGYAAATDGVEVQDSNGGLVWLALGNPDLTPIDSGKSITWINGLKVPTTKTDGNTNLPAGKLIIYIV